MSNNNSPSRERGVLHRLNATLGTSSYSTANDEINILRNQVNNLMELIKSQNEIIMGELAEIKVNVRELVKNTEANKTLMKIFPLGCTEKMDEFEKNIPKLAEDDLIAVIQKIIARGGITRNLHNLLGEDVLVMYNYNGVQNKKAFKTYTAINDIFYKAVLNDTYTKDNYITEIKKGFKISKNKLHKIKCLQKKKANDENSAP